MTLKHIRTRFLIPAFLMICLILSGCKDKTVTHTVTFDSNGGSEVAAQEVMNGKSAVEPKSPEKEGFTFTEWLLEDTAFDFTTPITQDITLTASYTVNEGTEIILVTFDAANKAPAKEVEIIKGGTVTPPADPSKEGFEFAGWYLDGKEFDFSSPLSENVTLRAKWNKVETTEEAEGSEEESSKESKPGAVGNKPGSSQGQQGTSTNPSQQTGFESTAAQYSGKWYKHGSSDIFLTITTDANSMHISSTNFSLYDPSNPPSVVNAFKIYPPSGNYDYQTTISFNNWNADLSNTQTTLGGDCIYIGLSYFVREKGTTDRYDGTCYREILGTWYLKETPSSKLTITTIPASNLSESDYFHIQAEQFNLKTLATQGNSSYKGRADQQESYNECGIWSDGNLLTVSNGIEVKEFFKTPTTPDPNVITGITLDCEAVTAYVGDTFTLHATPHPSNSVYPLTWTQTANTIASVDNNGKVTCHKAGTSRIDVFAAAYSIHASCTVTVLERPVTSVSISQTTADLKVGNTLQLSATANPSNATNRKIIWSSSNTAVANVSSNGLVTAISSGDVTITAKSAWDNNILVTCHIVITEETTPPTPPAPLEARASVGHGDTTTSSGIHKFISGSIYASGGSGNYSYQMNMYRNGVLIGTSTLAEDFFYGYSNGTFHIEFTVTDSAGQSVSGKSNYFTLN